LVPQLFGPPIALSNRPDIIAERSENAIKRKYNQSATPLRGSTFEYTSSGHNKDGGALSWAGP
jgi:hypothetical protein